MISITEQENNRLSFLKRHWLTVLFLLGFVTDYILLNRIDDTVDNLILLFYVIMASVSLLFFYVGVAEKAGEKLSLKLRYYMPMLMQYSFGGLLSGMLIFYGRSGDLLVSAPFFLLIILVIAVNELLKKQSDRLVYNLAVYFVGLFSYCVLVVPVLVGEIGGVIFVGSGILALFVFYLLVKILKLIIPRFMELQTRMLIFVTGILYVVFNAFYFLNLIPPIPLSLTELNIYQQVEKTTSGYRLVKEEKPLFEYVPFVPDYFHPIKNQGVYCFARVYAPTKLVTDITHRFEYIDTDGKWREHFRKTYTITGENKNGYRGFTVVNNIRDGKWRCVVENNRGQVLGRKTFTIDSSKAPEGLVTVVE